MVGAPSALALRRTVDGRVVVLVDAVLHGLVWVPLAVTSWTWGGVAGACVVMVLWCGTVVVAWRRRGAWPAGVRPVARQDLAWGGAWGAVLAVALVVRLRPADFLPWVGDMGAYVNWANELVRTGELRATWPPLLSADLAVSGLLFGTAGTTAGVPLMGMCLVLAVGRVVHQTTGARGAALAAGAATALQLHAVWYSTFPASESLTAPVLLIWLLLVHRLLAAPGGWPTTAGVAVATAALALLRGNAPLLLVPLTAVLVVALCARAWRPVLPGVWAAWGAAVVGSLVGYWYGISEIHDYFVTTQMGMMFPERLLDVLAELRLTDPVPTTALGLGVVVAAVLVGGTRLVRRRARADQGPGGRAVPELLLAATAAGWAALVVWQLAADGDVVQILSRMGWALVVGAVLGLVVVARSGDAPAQLLALLGGLLALVYLVLHATRLGSVRGHAFYLYWDRYLVSEVLPVALVLTFVGVAWLGRVLPARLPEPRARQLRVVACVVAASVVVLPGLGQLRLARSEVFLRGAHDLTEELSQAVDDAGDGRDLPVLWSADSTEPVPDWFFPNTWMAFAVPLDRTFGHDVLNVPSTGDGFLPDRVVDAAALDGIAACTGQREMVLLDLRTGGPAAGERLAGAGARAELRGAHQGVVQLLGQPAGDGWYSATFVVDVWKVVVQTPQARTNQECAEIM